MNPRYQKSTEFYNKVKNVIPLASQTFSKSVTQYPLGIAPLFISHAKGAKAWDIDGNEYIDMVCSLMSVTLGHADEDVNAAVIKQLSSGTSFTLPHKLEFEVAEKLSELIPCAEMVRFGKNGSDATSGAIRVARAYTGRDHVAVCGYHGWQDWYIGSTLRNKGVPKATQALTHTFKYNDIESLKKVFSDHPSQIAAVILEPMNTTEPLPGFLEEVKKVTHANGALLIFDEVITGFRFSLGGAQKYFNVTPDLASVGKGMANGFPISAVVGKAEYMKQMEEIFFSSTFGGDTISLAAALATIKKLEVQSGPQVLFERGTQLKNEIKALIQKHNLSDCLDFVGHPCWTFLVFKDLPQFDQWVIRTYFLQEMFKSGILTIGTNNLCLAHTEDILKHVLTQYDKVFQLISEAIRSGNLKQKLETEPLKPLFRVR